MIYEYAYAVLGVRQPDFFIRELLGFDPDSLEAPNGDYSMAGVQPDLTDFANVVGLNGWRLMWIISNGTVPVAYFERSKGESV
jgi:hypothetical protein